MLPVETSITCVRRPRLRPVCGVFSSIIAAMLASVGCSTGNDADAEDIAASMGDLHRDGNDRGGGGSCTITSDGRTLMLHVEVGGDRHGPRHHGHGSGHDRLVLVADRELDMTSPGRNVLSESAILRLRDGSNVYSYTLTSVPGRATRLEFDWGPLVDGANAGVFEVENGTITGNIDGRAFVPFPVGADPASVRFLDGRPAPRVRAEGLGFGTLKHFREQVEEAMKECERVNLGPSSESLSQALENQDPGHFSPTYDTLECDGCKAGVTAAGVLGGIACCAATFGIGCGVCIAADAAAVAAGILACEQSNACCPVACGDGIGSTCCFGDETCLNGAGLCCSAGTQTCAGLACCASDQSCIDAGPQRGTCCPDGSVCGQTCCESGSVCQNAATGQCCRPDKLCGSVCCGSGPISVLSCANPALSLCCPDGQADCGGQCCGGANRECRNGQCVLRPTIECGGRIVCVDPATGQQIVDDCPPSSNNDPGFCNLGSGCCDTLGAP
jgi:hypothetical protein